MDQTVSILIKTENPIKKLSWSWKNAQDTFLGKTLVEIPGPGYHWFYISKDRGNFLPGWNRYEWEISDPSPDNPPGKVFLEVLGLPKGDLLP